MSSVHTSCQEGSTQSVESQCMSQNHETIQYNGDVLQASCTAPIQCDPSNDVSNVPASSQGMTV